VAQAVFGRFLLVTGSEDLLVDRAVDDRIREARREQAEADVTDAQAPQIDAAALADMTGGSLFTAYQVAVLRDVGGLSDDLHPVLIALAASTPAETAIVAVHGGGTKGKKLLDGIKAAKVEVVDCPPVKPWDLVQFVNGEARRRSVRIDGEAAQLLVDAVGHDLRALSAAIDQLIADSDESRIGLALVRRYFGGRSEVTGFAVADAIVEGRTTDAMETLRWALDTGVSPVLITSAIASSLRRGAKLLDAAPGMRDNELARDIGATPGQLRKLRGQLRGWDSRGLATALALTAKADADVKGAAADAAYALERAVLGITGARGRRS